MKSHEEIRRSIDAHCRPYSCGECDYEKVIFCRDVMIKDAHALIQHLEAQVPRWIPVEEQMPEPHQDVAIIIRLDGYTYLRVGWYGCACQWMQAGLGMIEGDVTHWMPLPEVPREG